MPKKKSKKKSTRRKTTKKKTPAPAISKEEPIHQLYVRGYVEGDIGNPRLVGGYPYSLVLETKDLDELNTVRNQYRQEGRDTVVFQKK